MASDLTAAEPPGRRRRVESRRASPTVLRLVGQVDTLVHLVVAFLLLLIAVIVIYRTVDHLIVSRHDFATQVTNGINDVLFVVIVMELLRTVIAHLETSDFQLKPFLIIGIISAVRHILTVGARLTLSGEGNATTFRHSQIALGVSAAVVLALAIGLVLISRPGVEENVP